MNGSFEREVQAAAAELRGVAAAQGAPGIFRGPSGWLMKAAIADEALREALFQFVDVLPQLATQRDASRHLSAYLRDVDGTQATLLRLVARPPFAGFASFAVRRLARQFLVEETRPALAAALRRLAAIPAQATLDAVGEAVLTEAEADSYLVRNLRLLDWLAAAGAPHLSLKLTALTPHVDPADPRGTRARIFRRLAPLMERAIARGATLTVDMEHYELKPLVLETFLAMLEEWPQTTWHPALALQAYLPDSDADLEAILAAAQRHGRRLGVRLVKGAYWDQEIAWAAQRNWPRPVFSEKEATDASFARLTARLFQHIDSLHPAIASHNLYSQAVALAWARHLRVPAGRWEAQLLYGMAEPLRAALAAAGVQLRVYVPTGDAAVGIAYLIRRLLENTASTSVLRQTYVPDDDAASAQAASVPPAAPYFNHPLTDFSSATEREAFEAALRNVRTGLPRHHALPAGPARSVYRAVNPAAPGELLGTVELGDAAHADRLLLRAEAAFPAWRDTPAGERARRLRRAADLLSERRRELAALELLAVAKHRREADADVAEAIDFMRYYADGIEALAGWCTTRDFPGERNAFAYEPLGIALAIAPWNFPLAILAGMASAALAAGNCAILKPAQPGMLVAFEFHRALVEAGIPAEACPLLAAPGEVAAHLVAHPGIHAIAFTGSRDVGLSILHTAHRPVPGQRHVKRVVCEMGGKNAIVVDDDADLDDAVAGILASAFGYAGQKCSACSRVIAVGGIHARLLARLAEAADALPWGPPDDPAFPFGPLVDAAAQRKALEYLQVGRAEGRLVWQGHVPETGWYATPAIFAGIQPRHRLAREEIFAPILAVLHAPDFATALAMAQDADYALTGGVYSRLPDHLMTAWETYRVGNLYLNRKITGARVGIQPFGGIALSGTGIQAGGPDYLKQFLWTRAVSSNVMRRGLVARIDALHRR